MSDSSKLVTNSATPLSMMTEMKGVFKPDNLDVSDEGGSADEASTFARQDQSMRKHTESSAKRAGTSKPNPIRNRPIIDQADPESQVPMDDQADGDCADSPRNFIRRSNNLLEKAGSNKDTAPLKDRSLSELLHPKFQAYKWKTGSFQYIFCKLFLYPPENDMTVLLIILIASTLLVMAIVCILDIANRKGNAIIAYKFCVELIIIYSIIATAVEANKILKRIEDANKGRQRDAGLLNLTLEDRDLEAIKAKASNLQKLTILLCTIIVVEALGNCSQQTCTLESNPIMCLSASVILINVTHNIPGKANEEYIVYGKKRDLWAIHLGLNLLVTALCITAIATSRQLFSVVASVICCILSFGVLYCSLVFKQGDKKEGKNNDQRALCTSVWCMLVVTLMLDLLAGPSY